jgi:hypothetical protein
MPGVRDAVEGKRSAEAEEHAARLGQVLAAAAAVLDKAAEMLEPAGGSAGR